MYIVALLYNIRTEDLHSIDKIDLSYFYQDHYLFFNNLNRFVLDMLIPIHILEFVILNKKITDISKLAAIFEVSEMAMAHQLKRLS